MANLGKFKIDTDDKYKNLATITGLTFTTGTKYTMQVQDAIGDLTICVSENEPTIGGPVLENKKIFSYTPKEGDNIWVKTQENGGVYLNISE